MSLKPIWFWISTFTVALAIFAGLCWLDMRPGPTLYSAASAGDIKLVKRLLTAGADVNALDKESLTPLMYAVQAGHSEAMDLLLASGADINRVGQKGNTALHFSAPPAQGIFPC